MRRSVRRITALLVLPLLSFCGDAGEGPLSPTVTHLTPAGGVAPSPVPAANGAVLLEDGFESGDFVLWSGKARHGDPCWEGRGGDGAHVGDGCISSELVHTGALAWRSTVDPNEPNVLGPEHKSQLQRHKTTKGVFDFWISAWYYIPTDYPQVRTNLLQIKKAGDSGDKHPLAAIVHDKKRQFILRAYESVTMAKSGVRVPYGRWFNLTAHFITAQEGQVEVFLDGTRIMQASYDTIEDAAYAYFGMGNYTTSKATPSHFYMDDVRVTR